MIVHVAICSSRLSTQSSSACPIRWWCPQIIQACSILTPAVLYTYATGTMCQTHVHALSPGMTSTCREQKHDGQWFLERLGAGGTASPQCRHVNHWLFLISCIIQRKTKEAYIIVIIYISNKKARKKQANKKVLKNLQKRSRRENLIKSFYFPSKIRLFDSKMLITRLTINLQKMKNVKLR